MTLNEMQGFQRTLAARVAELERITRQRDGITIERSADQMDELQGSSERALAVGNLSRDCSQLGNARAVLAAFRMAVSGFVSGAMRTSIQSVSRPSRGLPIASAARKPSIATLRSSRYRSANSSPELHEGRRMWDTPKHYAQRLTEAAWRRATMPMFALLNPGKKGVQPQNPESSLRHLIVRQHEAIHEIVRACQTHLAGLRPIGRPVANFLFLGRAGSRKTRVVEATAEALLKDSRAVIKINCAEFQQGHEIAKLIGPPPGCLGNRETHALLSQEALNRHHRDKVKLSFLLFDEIEKASDALWNLLIGIMNKATLTLGDNRTVDFSATMVFLTSNLGASEMNSLVTARPGFHDPPLEIAGQNSRLRARVSDARVAAARRRFTPEFINRLDKIVVFKSLGSRN